MILGETFKLELETSEEVEAFRSLIQKLYVMWTNQSLLVTTAQEYLLISINAYIQTEHPRG